ncbi:hypothetical protein [Bradyrhizobium quebecense]|uniref:Uncharacterized protein n=2 Tax=Bradyrhizobium quebecense TaxID=2748629 RepID=A0ACD3V4U8_9BRAD|nr:hypothetical protein [Bradyrhizobium quebecense]UGY01377.1 hypothetical protein J4P68_0030310 [Bradyrhizobium quebecense]
MKRSNTIGIVTLVVAVALVGAVGFPIAKHQWLRIKNVITGIHDVQNEQGARIEGISKELAAVKAQLAPAKAQSEKAGSLANDLAALQFRFERLAASEKLSVANSQSAAKSQSGANERLAFLDPVDLYQKAGLVEVYGGVFTQRRIGPIRVDAAILTSEQQVARLIWSPDRSEPADVDQINVELSSDTLDAGQISIAVALDDHRVFVWQSRLGDDMLSQAAPAGGNEPEGVDASIANGTHLSLTETAHHSLVGSVPRELHDALLSSGQDHHIRRWILTIEGMTNTAFAVRAITFTKSGTISDPSEAASIYGRITGAAPEPGSSLELVFEDGRRRHVELSLDNGFGVTDLPPNQPVSLRFRLRGVEYYASSGRWLFPVGQIHVTIPVGPEFPNPAHLPPNPKAVRLEGGFATVEGVPSYYRYAPHRVTSWPGGGSVQEFAGISFANNFGQLDRDRVSENRDRCLRIFVVGGSGLVSLQVKPGEKFNLVAESELGIKMGRCVEVISAGRDNGNLGANYRAIRDYGMRFDPDIIVFEHNAAYALQLNAALIKKSLGYNYEHSPLDNFYFDKGGQLTFRNWDAVWALDAVAPDPSPLLPGLPMYQAFSIPREDFIPEAKASFDLLLAIIKKLKSDFPRTHIAMLTALDQANCRKSTTCASKITLPDQRTVPMGIEQELQNFSALCKEAGISCIQAPTPDGSVAGHEPLQYADDAHFSVHGHQWLGRLLANGLETIVRDEGLAGSKRF